MIGKCKNIVAIVILMYEQDLLDPTKILKKLTIQYLVVIIMKQNCGNYRETILNIENNNAFNNLVKYLNEPATDEEKEAIERGKKVFDSIEFIR